MFSRANKTVGIEANADEPVEHGSRDEHDYIFVLSLRYYPGNKTIIWISIRYFKACQLNGELAARTCYTWQVESTKIPNVRGEQHLSFVPDKPDIKHV